MCVAGILDDIAVDERQGIIAKDRTVLVRPCIVGCGVGDDLVLQTGGGNHHARLVFVVHQPHLVPGLPINPFVRFAA